MVPPHVYVLCGKTSVAIVCEDRPINIAKDARKLSEAQTESILIISHIPSELRRTSVSAMTSLYLFTRQVIRQATILTTHATR